MKMTRIYIAILLVAAITAGSAGCAATGQAQASDLMGEVTPNRIDGRMADSAFVKSMADFSIELFKQSITDGKNSLISPLSVTLALAMTANGADGETLAQMEKLLGGSIPVFIGTLMTV